MKGDLVVELDDSDLQNDLTQIEILVNNAKANLLQAEASLAAQKLALDTGTSAAEGALRVAQLARNKFLGDGGEFDVELLTVTKEIDLAKRKLELAEKRIAQLAKEGIVVQALGDAQLDRAHAHNELDVATAKKRLLVTHVRAHQTAVLDLALAKAEVALSQTVDGGTASVRQAEAEMRSRQAMLKAEQAKLEHIKQQIVACKIHAPAAGTVVYGNVYSSRSASQVIIEPGAPVRPRQVIVRLPDMNRLQVNTFVNETRISLVRVGQAATIRCDAFFERAFKGHVLRVSLFPEPANFWINQGKRYAVAVSIDEPVEGLRVGLSALVEIDVAEPKKD